MSDLGIGGERDAYMRLLAERDRLAKQVLALKAALRDIAGNYEPAYVRERVKQALAAGEPS